jgi:tripartite ATP-independent transporter DctP family solute receptor
MNGPISRRSVLGFLSGVVLQPRRARAAPAEFRCRQFHNQPEDSTLHRYLVEMWAAVKAESQGRFEVVTFAENANIPGSDPEACRMLASGQLEFFTVFGAPLGFMVPIAEMQALPFAFKDRQQAVAATDGRFGDYLRADMAAKGIYGFRRGAFENGFRQISTTAKPIRTADDLAGLKLRTPDSKLFTDFFTSLGAETKVFNFNRVYEALKKGEVDGQDNPIEVTAVNKLYEVQKYISVTNHMWACFNLLANLKFWNSVPADLQAVIERNVDKYVALQRQRQDELNRSLAQMLTSRGMVFTEADTSTFRRRLGPFYARWKRNFGTTAWSLLEEYVGPLG